MPDTDPHAPLPPAQPGTGSARRRTLLAWAGVAVGTALVAVFGLRTWHQLDFDARVASGVVQVASLRGWMTLPYIARVYGVPEADLRRAIGVPPAGDESRSLREWFAATGLGDEAGRRAVEALILAHQATAAGASRPAP